MEMSFLRGDRENFKVLQTRLQANQPSPDICSGVIVIRILFQAAATKDEGREVEVKGKVERRERGGHRLEQNEAVAARYRSLEANTVSLQ